jgi:hypothetical protein
VAKASSFICAPVSGDAASMLDNVVLGFRRLCGIMDCSYVSGPSLSMSREERPRCAVRSFAAARIAGGVRYGRGKDCMVL